MKIRADIELANLTDAGCERANNEDYYCYIEPENDGEFDRKGRLIAIADGMGGHAGGQVASTLALDALRAVFQNGAPEKAEDLLVAGFARAQASILAHAAAHPELNGMGTTCTAAILRSRQLFYGHIGDSRLYMLRAGRIQQLTRDHSLVNALVENGTISPDEVACHPRKNVLTRALGMRSSEVAADFYGPLPLLPGDTLILCSDGLHGLVSDEEMGQIAAAESPYNACRSLVALAKERGGPDNITVQVLCLRPNSEEQLDG